MVKIFLALIIIAGVFGVGSFGYKYLSSKAGSSEENIIKDLQISDKIDCGEYQEACSVEKIYGNFAKGNMKMAYWIAQKDFGGWKMVISGNGIPSCGEVDKYTVPVEIYGNCIEASGELRN